MGTVVRAGHYGPSVAVHTGILKKTINVTLRCLTVVIGVVIVAVIIIIN